MEFEKSGRLQLAQKCIRCENYMRFGEKTIDDPQWKDCVSHVDCVPEKEQRAYEIWKRSQLPPPIELKLGKARKTMLTAAEFREKQDAIEALQLLDKQIREKQRRAEEEEEEETKPDYCIDCDARLSWEYVEGSKWCGKCLEKQWI